MAHRLPAVQVRRAAWRAGQPLAKLGALLLDQIASLDVKIAELGARAAELAAAMPEGWGTDPDGTTGPGAGTGPDAPVLNAVARLAEIPASAPTWPRPSSPKPA
jgi:hypothetical protein